MVLLGNHCVNLNVSMLVACAIVLDEVLVDQQSYHFRTSLNIFIRILLIKLLFTYNFIFSVVKDKDIACLHYVVNVKYFRPLRHVLTLSMNSCESI